MVSRLMATSGLKATVFDAIGRSLTPLGFRRRGTTFRRELAQVVQLVQVQTSQSSSSAVTKLTVNFAVLAPSLSNDRLVRPAVEAAHWRQRIGHLMPGHRDLWRCASSVVGVGTISRINGTAAARNAQADGRGI